jgi:hypothetical protein
MRLMVFNRSFVVEYASLHLSACSVELHTYTSGS